MPSYAVADLRRAGVVRISRKERLLPTLATTLQLATDPLVPFEWWRAAVGADQVDPPGPGKPVTVVDSGLDLSHPEFATRPNTTALNPQTTSDADEDHGTAVASVVAATNNGVGIVGIYPEAVLRVWDASPFGFLNEGAAIEGIYEAARRGPGVINLSFGGEDDDPLLDDAIQFAFRSGSLVVAAAGNEALDGNPPNFPAFYPARSDGRRDGREEPRGCLLDHLADGRSRCPRCAHSCRRALRGGASGYSTTGSGTSFASPLAAGAAAWVWTTRPDLDNTQLFELMRRSATDIAVPGFDNASGYGLLNIPGALNFRTPTSDPQEPNEKPREIEAHGLFSSRNSAFDDSGTHRGIGDGAASTEARIRSTCIASGRRQGTRCERKSRARCGYACWSARRTCVRLL